MAPAGDVLIVVVAVAVDLAAWAGDGHVRGKAFLSLVTVPVLTVACYSTLVLRWRYPIGAFGLQWVFTLSSVLVLQFQPFAGLLVALHALASRRSASWSGPALASSALPFSIYSAFAAEMGPGGSTMAFLQILVLWLAVGRATWGVGRR